MRLLAVALGLLALAACAKKEPPPPSEPASPSVVSAQPPPIASAPTPEPSASTALAPEVPVEEDFEDEASLQVNAQTLDDQLDALEKEIKAN